MLVVRGNTHIACSLLLTETERIEKQEDAEIMERLVCEQHGIKTLQDTISRCFVDVGGKLARRKIDFDGVCMCFSSDLFWAPVYTLR